MSDIEPGNVVQLCAGGPRMAVVYVEQPDARDRRGPWCLCSWFAGGEYRERRFPAVVLEPVDGDE